MEGLRSTIGAAQAARLVRPTRGAWEAADVAWWWRQPRSTDAATTRVRTDDGVPTERVTALREFTSGRAIDTGDAKFLRHVEIYEADLAYLRGLVAAPPS